MQSGLAGGVQVLSRGGVWRPRMAGKSRVDLTVTAFEQLTATQRERVEAETGEVARARGVSAVTTVFE